MMIGRSFDPRGEGGLGGSSKKVHRHIASKKCVHNPWTHFPKDPNCDICNDVKRNRAQCRTKTYCKPDTLPTPLKFADSLTADQTIINENDASRESDRVALIILDRYSRWLQGYASKQKTAAECEKFFKRFVGPQCKPEHVYTDNSQEFLAALKELNWPHDTSTPHRSETNGCIERHVRVVNEGTSCAMVQSGLDEAWWPQAMNCFCYLKNVIDLLDDGQTAYQRRWKTDFAGPLIPLGAEVNWKPISQKDKARLHAFGSSVLSGIFLGYDQ